MAVTRTYRATFALFDARQRRVPDCAVVHEEYVFVVAGTWGSGLVCRLREHFSGVAEKMTKNYNAALGRLTPKPKPVGVLSAWQSSAWDYAFPLPPAQHFKVLLLEEQTRDGWQKRVFTLPTGTRQITSTDGAQIRGSLWP